MSKKFISSLELAALVNEMQFLVSGTISQIYHLSNKNEFLIQIHLSGKGKQTLKIIPGKLMCLTTSKETMPEKPTSFCMQLRKYLDHAFIKALYQQDTERIVVLELDKKEKFYLIIELFSKGNVILTDHQKMIIGSLENQNWKDRLVKPKEKYVLPPASINWKKISLGELKQILSQSEKKNVVISLATDLGLGGVYAEELCLVSKLNKEKSPQQLTENEYQSLLEKLKHFLKIIEKPQGFMYDEQVAPFALQGQKAKKILATYNEAIDTLNPLEKISPYEKKIKLLERMLEDQKESVSKQAQVMEQNKKKGEQIYEKYTPLQKLLGIVKELRKNKDWKEVALELKKEKKITQINLKDKKITLDL